MNRPFDDRHDAGRRLADRLPPLTVGEAVVLALPRGGVPVAEPICERFGLPLDLALVRKIGAPGQPELALGAVAEGDPPGYVINERIAHAFGLDAAAVRARGQSELAELERRRQVYLGAAKRAPLAGKTVIVVDDGAATGATLRAALAAVRAAAPARLIVALPVAPADLLATLEGEADEVLCLTSPEPFYAVGQAYRSFPQVADDAVRAALARYGPDAAEPV